MDSSEEIKSKHKGLVPVLRNFILCDLITKDQFGGKESLINVFENVQAQVFPCHMSLWYYCVLINGHGSYEVEFILRNVLTGKSALMWTGTFQLEPLKNAAFINHISPTFESPGPYEFIIKLRDGRVIGERQFTVNQLPQQAPSV